MRYRTLSLPFLLACLLFSSSLALFGRDFTRYVCPRIGTGGHGHVFFGANVPFGLVQLGPVSVPNEWDWCSGYHDSDSTVLGLAHTHLSGTGIGDLCDVMLLPSVGKVCYQRGTRENPHPGLCSTSLRSRETCEPGYYRTVLRSDGRDIGVELTATARVGFHHYSFPADAAEPSVIVDLSHGTGWDRPVSCRFRVRSPYIVEGWRLSRGWAGDQRVYFSAHFSRPIQAVRFGVPGSEAEKPAVSVMEAGQEGEEVFARLVFASEAKGDLYVKVALSPLSCENAEENLHEELSGWRFSSVRQKARDLWNRQLSKMDVETMTEEQKKVFYTALYHTMMVPSLFCDVNGEYYGADHRKHRAEGWTPLTTLSLWDTYRAASPLFSLIHPERVGDLMQTMLHIFQEQGKLPVWHLWGNETNTMVGNPAIPVVADMMLKGFSGFSKEQAYEAMRVSAMLDERGQKWRKMKGYIPFDQYNESVATDMEYAIADAALARSARALGKAKDALYFTLRSHSYRHYWDPSTGFLRGLSSEGAWRDPFSPFVSRHREDDYTEGNAWQYTFLVPHDTEGLAALMGGRQRLLSRLDSLFLAQGDLGAEASPDISGLIGQYAHGNEPSHHIIYMYSLLGAPEKAAPLLRKVMTEFYHAAPDGLIGNEDAGQMSAWYLLSSLGLYQVEPAGGDYVLGSPLVRDARVRVSGGALHVKAHGQAADSPYVRRVLWNGKVLRSRTISHALLSRGGTLEFFMGREPVDFAKAAE